MAEVVLEELMVHMMVGGCTEPKPSKGLVPDKGILRVNESEPTGVQASKGHVSPHVAGSHDIGCDEEWNGNHTYGVRQ